jgi:hypothetical protein
MTAKNMYAINNLDIGNNLSVSGYFTNSYLRNELNTLSSVIVLCNNNLQSQINTSTSTISTNNTNTNNTLNSHQTQINTLSSVIVATNNNLQSQINILGGNTYQSQLDTLTSTVSTNNTNTNNTLNTKQNQINTLSSVIVLVNNNLQSQVNTITSTVSTNNTNTNNTLNSHQTQINTISSYVSTFSSYSNNYIGNIAYTGNVGIGGNLTIAGNASLNGIIKSTNDTIFLNSSGSNNNMILYNHVSPPLYSYQTINYNYFSENSSFVEYLRYPTTPYYKYNVSIFLPIAYRWIISAGYSSLTVNSELLTGYFTLFRDSIVYKNYVLPINFAGIATTTAGGSAFDASQYCMTLQLDFTPTFDSFSHVYSLSGYISSTVNGIASAGGLRGGALVYSTYTGIQINSGTATITSLGNFTPYNIGSLENYYATASGFIETGSLKLNNNIFQCQGYSGAYLICSGNGGTYPILTSYTNYAIGLKSNADYGYLVNAGYTLLVYTATAYGGTVYTYDNINGKASKYFTGTSTGNSCKLSFYTTQSIITGLS